MENYVQVVLIGPYKNPSYCKGNDWNNVPCDGEVIGDDLRPYMYGYHIANNGGYQVGDDCSIGTYRAEVYGAHRFETQDEADEWIMDNYPELKEI